MSGICPACGGGGTATEADFFQRSGIPDGCRDFRLDTWGAKGQVIPPWATSYAETFPPGRPFLLLVGPTGTGKTGLAIAILYQVWALHRVTGLFQPVTDFLQDLKDSFDGDGQTADVQRRLKQSPLLVLDDYMAHRETDWSTEQMFTVIDHRHRERLPTIVTTNRPPERMLDRIGSRLRDAQVSTVLEVGGPDRRLIAMTETGRVGGP